MESVGIKLALYVQRKSQTKRMSLFGARRATLVRLLWVLLSTVEPNHDPPHSAHRGPHRPASDHEPQHAEEKVTNAGRRDVFCFRVPEIAHIEG